jgi:hypothetical protein
MVWSGASDRFLSVQSFGYVVEAAMNILKDLKHLPEHIKNNSPERDSTGEQENDANETLYHGKHLHARAEFTPAESERTAGASNRRLELIVGGFGHARERGQGALGYCGFALRAFEFAGAG